MQKVHQRSIYAGIIPTYSLSNVQQSVLPSLNWQASKENTILDYNIFMCARSMCDIIILICLPEQLPYFRYRYGDVFLDTGASKYPDIVRGDLKDIRPLPIYYFCVSEKYRNQVDTDVFNVFHAASTFIKAVDESFSIISPTHFFFVFPFNVIVPYYYLFFDGLFTKEYREFYSSPICLYNNKEFQFRIKTKEEYKYFFPNKSHIALDIGNVQRIWSFIYEKWRQYKQSKLPKEDFMNILKFDKLIDGCIDEEKGPFYDIPAEYVFNLNKWDEYVRLLNYTSRIEDKLGGEFVRQHTTKYIQNMTKLTYHLNAPMIQDTHYYIRKKNNIKKDEHYSAWERQRNKNRAKENK